MKNNHKTLIYSAITGLVVFIVTIIGLIFLFVTASLVFDFSPVTGYEQIKNEVISMYDGEVDEEYMDESITEGIVNGLGDPHSEYFTQEELDSFEMSLTSSFKGIGVTYTLDTSDNTIVITEVFDQGAAQKAGLYAGDRILKINGEEMNEENYDDAGNLIKANDTVNLEIYRPSEDETFDVDIALEQIDLPSVSGRVDDVDGKKIAYIQITSFSENTGVEFNNLIAEFEKENISGLVIDVRNNGGGYLSSVETILDYLVTNEKPYLTTKRDGEVQDEYYSKVSEPKDYEIVVVQNENTASASEVLSGALLELNNSDIVGKKSYGKGSVQQTFPLSNDQGAVKVTVEHWFTPDDNTIDQVGISPTVQIDDTEPYYSVTPLIFNQNISNGEYSTNAQLINYYLGLLDYDVEIYSNNYDSKTEAAIKSFQTEKGLEATGIVDVVTADALYRDAFEVSTKVDNDIYIQKAYELI